MALLNTLMAINLINGNIWLYAAILVVALVAVFFLALRKVEVVYVDPDEDYEIAHTKYGWGRKIDVATANKNGKIFVGWSYDENGEKRLGKKQIRVWKSTELYAVWQKPVVGITVEDANAVLEITFKNKDGEEISKEIRPFAIDIPEEADGEKILGWNYEDAENESAGIIASDKEKNIIPVNLVPVYESSDEAVAEEPAYEEPVVEEEAVADEEVAVADEEPVAEEVVAEEQVAEEPVAEEPVVEDEAVAEEVAEEAAPVEPIIVPTYVDGQGRKINIRYSRSIQANVIQAEDKVKNYYSELKNHILSYKGVKSRFSWKFDSYNKGREQLFKIKVRGKTVCLYCALNPEEFDKSRYHHEAVDAKMLADVPMLVKVKSDLGLKKAKELVDIVMAKHEIVVNPKAVSVDYVNEYPYEETDALVQRGLIKVLEADENDVKIAAPAEDAVAEEVVVEEQVAEEVVAEEPVVEDEAVAEEVAEEAAPVEPIIVPTYVDGQGRKINIRYSRSIQANVIQAEDKVKNYYSELKNHILSYKGVKSRFSWKFDSYNKGREQLFKIKVRGKTVCLYCALNPEEFDKSRYHHEAVDAKMLADVPMLVKVKSDLGLKKAKELVDIVMAKHEIVVNPKAVSVDYVNEYPYEETDALVQRGLIKVLEADENDVKIAAPAEDAVAEEVVVEEQVAEEVVAEEPVVEDEAVAEEVAEEPLFEEVIEEPIPVDDEPVVEEEAVAEEVVAEEEPVAEEEAVAEEVVADEEPVVEEEAVAEEEPVAEEEAVAEEVVANEEPVAEEEAVAEEVVADEEPVVEEEAVAEEVVADEEPVAEEEAVAEEVVADEEPVVEEEVVAEEIAPATSVEEMHIVESVSADEVDDLVVDEVVDSLVEEDVEYITKDDNKKAIVNIDTISQSYEAGEVVDLASLKAKGLIHKKSKSVKILARGSIDKALTVKAAEFSETALKMIVLTGGKAVHTVSKVK